MTELKGRKALVTGASRGIGRAIALALGARGAEIYGTATTEAGAADVGAALDAAGIRGAGLVLELRSRESVEALPERLNELGASIDILVNNAGITRDGLLLRMSEEDWNAVIETNLKSVYRLSRIFARAMSKARWGRIINVTSVSGLAGNAGQCNYAAAKAGVVGFTKSLARELAPRGVTVNCVAPGFIDTDMTRALSEEQRDAVVKQIPVGRFGTADEIAYAVLMLAGDAAGYVTGETICVTGGLYMQ